MVLQNRWSSRISLFIIPILLMLLLFFHSCSSCSGRKDEKVKEELSKSNAIQERIQESSKGKSTEEQPKISEAIQSLQSRKPSGAGLESGKHISSQPTEKKVKKRKPKIKKIESLPKDKSTILQEVKEPSMEKEVEQIPVEKKVEENPAEFLEEVEKSFEIPEAPIEKSPGEPYLMLGHTAFRKKDYRDAIKYLKMAVEEDPNLFLAHYWLGRTYAEKGRHFSAVKAFEKAIATRAEEDKDIDVEQFLAREYIEASKYKKAIPLYKERIEKDPSDFENRFWYAFALKGAGCLMEAVQSYRKAIEINPDLAAIHYNLANTLEEIGNNKEAIEEYRAAIALNPDYGKAYFNLAAALEEEGRLEEAIEAFNKCIELDHKSWQSKRRINLILKKKE